MVGECVLLLFFGAFLRVVSSGGVVGGVPVNGVLGFFTGSPSIDRHLWAVQCGYEPGPRVVGCGTGVAGLLAWLGGMGIEVTESLPPVCVGASVVAASADVVMLRMLVDEVLFGVVNMCELKRRISLVGKMLYDVVLRERAISRRSAPYVVDLSE
jgi:hypothetical protein